MAAAVPDSGVQQSITARLAILQPESMEILDESALHHGHEGAKSGGGHFRLLIVSNAFRGKSLAERHRMIYSALGTLMQRDIHALAIKAYAPDEI